MSQSDQTVATPEQCRTETYMVFGDDSIPATLLARVEVPLFSQPTGEGTRLSRPKREALAVNRAFDGAQKGEVFYVLSDMMDSYTPVEYEENPAFDAVWNPEEE